MGEACGVEKGAANAKRQAQSAPHPLGVSHDNTPSPDGADRACRFAFAAPFSTLRTALRTETVGGARADGYTATTPADSCLRRLRRRAGATTRDPREPSMSLNRLIYY